MGTHQDINKDKVITMSILADKIEQFILQKISDNPEENVLRRNELADELDCAPSQISYVLSTRFSNERGFIVESRRGLGGYIRITKIPVTIETNLPAVLVRKPIYQQDIHQTLHQERLIEIGDIDKNLYELMQNNRLTRREAMLMHEAFEALINMTRSDRRNEAVRRLYKTMINTLTMKEG